MVYQLKNGETVTIRVPTAEDASALVHLMIAQDSQTRFLARNPGEFQRGFTVEREAACIRSMESNPNLQWYVDSYGGPDNLLRAAAKFLMDAALGQAG